MLLPDEITPEQGPELKKLDGQHYHFATWISLAYVDNVGTVVSNFRLTAPYE